MRDNAIDAGATSIEVAPAVRGQKLQEIVVSDNGVGMIPEVLGLCLEHRVQTARQRGQRHSDAGIPRGGLGLDRSRFDGDPRFAPQGPGRAVPSVEPRRPYSMPARASHAMRQREQSFETAILDVRHAHTNSSGGHL
ncbi:ATP-binding protein [Sinorhizobium kostiense]|uniref:ATP-binding protein n=1 Tax=Sinorhizobium kostiense TaxID=76747 RepID=UPI001AE1263E